MSHEMAQEIVSIAREVCNKGLEISIELCYGKEDVEEGVVEQIPQPGNRLVKWKHLTYETDANIPALNAIVKSNQRVVYNNITFANAQDFFDLILSQHINHISHFVDLECFDVVIVAIEPNTELMYVIDFWHNEHNNAIEQLEKILKPIFIKLSNGLNTEAVL